MYRGGHQRRRACSRGQPRPPAPCLLGSHTSRWRGPPAQCPWAGDAARLKSPGIQTADAECGCNCSCRRIAQPVLMIGTHLMAPEMPSILPFRSSFPTTATPSIRPPRLAWAGVRLSTMGAAPATGVHQGCASAVLGRGPRSWAPQRAPNQPKHRTLYHGVSGRVQVVSRA